MRFKNILVLLVCCLLMASLMTGCNWFKSDSGGGSAKANPDLLLGWADVAGDNGQIGEMVQTTTGGEGGQIKEVTTVTELKSLLAELQTNPVPTIIRIKGTLMDQNSSTGLIKLNNLKNITIEGIGNTTMTCYDAINLSNSYNIIIRNIFFINNTRDAINLSGRSTHHVWIDRCSFSDVAWGSGPIREAATSDNSAAYGKHDGLIDIGNGSGYVTISYCHFENHKKAMLFGSGSGDAANDVGHLKVTLHHNWIGYVAERSTRNRFGQIHLFNNYYDNTGTMLEMTPKNPSDGIYQHGYGILSALGAQVVVENNYFKNVLWPTLVVRKSVDPVWAQTYGYITSPVTGQPVLHFSPNFEEDPGYITYRGTNIQDPVPGTEVNLGEATYKILPFDTTSPDPTNWNPWDSYGYDQKKINGVLHNAKSVPSVIKAYAGAK